MEHTHAIVSAMRTDATPESSMSHGRSRRIDHVVQRKSRTHVAHVGTCDGERDQQELRDTSQRWQRNEHERQAGEHQYTSWISSQRSNATARRRSVGSNTGLLRNPWRSQQQLSRLQADFRRTASKQEHVLARALGIRPRSHRVPSACEPSLSLHAVARQRGAHTDRGSRYS